MLTDLFLLGYRQRQMIVPIIVLLTVLFAAALPRLKVDTGLDSLVPANNIDRVAYQRVQEEFGTDNRLQVFVHDEQLWTPEKLIALQQLHDALNAIEGVTRVESVLNVRTLKRDAGRVISGPVIPQLPDNTDQAVQLRDTALQNPLLRRTFISDDGMSIALVIAVETSRLESDSARALYQQIEERLQTARPSFAEVFQTGPARLAAELRVNLYRDLLWLGTASALIMLLTILISVRSGVAAAVPLITSIITLIWTFGALAWIGLPVNILSAMLPSSLLWWQPPRVYNWSFPVSGSGLIPAHPPMKR